MIRLAVLRRDMEAVGVQPLAYFGRWVRGLWVLLRIIPVAAWSLSALFIGIALAHADGAFNPLHIVLMYAGAILVQGFATHAYNDVADWRSGTDPASPRILSGGSHVIPEGYFTPWTLRAIGAASLLLAVAIGLYFIIMIGPGVAVILVTGILAAVFYTTPPLRLGYRPFMGEWLAALPALTACTVGAFFILVGSVGPVVILAGTIHGVLCIGRLMNHHLPDMEADASARPRKNTTILWARDRWGPEAVRWVGTSYFLVAALMSAADGFLVTPALWIPMPFALTCAALQTTVRPWDLSGITRTELWMTFLIVLDALALGLAFHAMR